MSQAKGLPWLLDAFDAMVATDPECRLHIAGGGAGAEAERLLSRIRSTPNVEYHGRVDQQRLAQLMREAAVFVLPSLYEGLPLVLVEAAACGCRLVSTALPAVEGELAPVLADTLSTVPVPRLKGPDIPAEADLPEFVSNLTMALRRALDSPLLGDPQLEGPEVLDNFTWKAVFQRIESMWTTLIDSR